MLHIILAHHGTLEHGSPVVPCTREATLVHMIDNLGGRLGSFDRLEKELPDGSRWSPFDRALSGSAWFSDAPRAPSPRGARGSAGATCAARPHHACPASSARRPAASTSAAGNVSATAAAGWPAWSSTATATDANPGVTEPSSCGVARRARTLGELAPQLRQRRRARAVALRRTPRAAGNSARSCARRQRGEHRQAAGGQVRREPDADVGDQARPAGARAPRSRRARRGRAARRGGRCGSVASTSRASTVCGDPAQRLLARVGRAELEGGDAEPVAALLGQVHDEALVARARASRW